MAALLSLKCMLFPIRKSKGVRNKLNNVFTKKRFLLLVMPITLFFILYSIASIIMAFFFSFTNYRGVGAFVLNGVTNYTQLFHDEFFWMSIGNTLKITVTQLILSLVISFLVAYAVNRKCLRNEIYKTILFAPYVIPGIITGLIWVFFLDPVNGLLNFILNALGLKAFALQWIGGKALTPYLIGVVGTWSSMGFNMAIWLMGMKNLSAEVLESCVIDGANKIQTIWYVILPMLKETFITLFIFTLTGCLKVFDTVFIMTGGGPNHYSETLISYMYNTTFVSRLYGYGMSIATVEFMLAIVLTLIFLFVTRKRIEE
jgi:raffinose/stachyose/melibiose transport system permease protein